MKKKKFIDTKIGAWLADKAPDVLGVVGDAIPYPFSAGVKLVKGLISNHKDLAPEIKEEFNNLELEFLQEETELQKIYLDDRKDARQLQVAALNQEDKFSKRFAYILAAFSVVCGFAYIFCVTWVKISPDNQRFADAMTGVITTVVFGQIFSFFFGSSSGSKNKSQQIDKLIETKTEE